ncbi:MAG: signal peptidase I [Alphaproteobacteria bacterium]|nr:signal peptidase I [Alphaproteobacteria bacterium]
MTTTTEVRTVSALDSFWENVRTILYALALAMLIRFTVAQPFRIPSGSMQPTLEQGDYIVVTKWSYGYSRFSFTPLDRFLPGGRIFGGEPERGDIVVFRPAGQNRDFVKRLIGLPGDRIRMVNSVLHINGEPVGRAFIGERDAERLVTETEYRTSTVDLYQETLPNGARYLSYDEHPNDRFDNSDQDFIVPAGHYFMMGDDRDNSQDSRTQVVGMVPRDNLIGPAQFIFASFDRSTSIFRPWTLFTGFRGDRFLKPLN